MIQFLYVIIVEIFGFVLLPLLVKIEFFPFLSLSLSSSSRSSTDAFRNAIIVKKNTKFPIVQIGSANFLWIREKNIYICACTPSRCNAAVVFEVLYRLIAVFKAYFKGEFDEATIMSNAGLMLELLDGFPLSDFISIFIIFPSLFIL